MKKNILVVYRNNEDKYEETQKILKRFDNIDDAKSYLLKIFEKKYAKAKKYLSETDSNKEEYYGYYRNKNFGDYLLLNKNISHMEYRDEECIWVDFTGGKVSFCEAWDIFYEEEWEKIKDVIRFPYYPRNTSLVNYYYAHIPQDSITDTILNELKDRFLSINISEDSYRKCKKELSCLIGDYYEDFMYMIDNRDQVYTFLCDIQSVLKEHFDFSSYEDEDDDENTEEFDKTLSDFNQFVIDLFVDYGLIDEDWEDYEDPVPAGFADSFFEPRSSI